MVELQTTAANGIDNGGIVYHSVLYTKFHGSNDQISVGGCPTVKEMNTSNREKMNTTLPMLVTLLLT